MIKAQYKQSFTAKTLLFFPFLLTFHKAEDKMNNYDFNVHNYTMSIFLLDMDTPFKKLIKLNTSS